MIASEPRSVLLGTWLTAARAMAWCRVLALGEVAWVAALLGRGFASARPSTVLISSDFTCFWSAAVLAVRAGPGAAYDPAAIAALEHRVQAMPADLVAPFLYPPTYLLLCLPLAVAGCGLAALAFAAAGLAPFLACVRRLLPQGWRWLPVLAFPGILVTAGTQQNGFFSGLCFAGGALLLDTTPLLGGACLGMLTCKPQLAALVPVALIAAGRWRALAGAAASALGLALISVLCLGTGAWAQFFATTREAGRILAGGLTDPSKLQSVVGAVQILRGPPGLGFGLQALASAAALLLLAGVARRRPGGAAEMATLVVATLFASPYVMDYDLVILAIPLAWMATEAQRGAWRPFEKYTAFGAYMMPMLTRGLSQHEGVPLAPLLLGAFLLSVAARAAGRAQTATPWLAPATCG